MFKLLDYIKTRIKIFFIDRHMKKLRNRKGSLQFEKYKKEILARYEWLKNNY